MGRSIRRLVAGVAMRATPCRPRPHGAAPHSRDGRPGVNGLRAPTPRFRPAPPAADKTAKEVGRTADRAIPYQDAIKRIRGSIRSKARHRAVVVRIEIRYEEAAINFVLDPDAVERTPRTRGHRTRLRRGQ